MIGEIYIEQYDSHTEVYMNGVLLEREQAVATLTEILANAFDEKSTYLARTIMSIENENKRLS